MAAQRWRLASVLCRLLQDSLGGNSKSTILVALRIEAQNIEESVNTLRFAQRAKAVKMKVCRRARSPPPLRTPARTYGLAPRGERRHGVEGRLARGCRYEGCRGEGRRRRRRRSEAPSPHRRRRRSFRLLPALTEELARARAVGACSHSQVTDNTITVKDTAKLLKEVETMSTQLETANVMVRQLQMQLASRAAEEDDRLATLDEAVANGTAGEGGASVDVVKALQEEVAILKRKNTSLLHKSILHRVVKAQSEKAIAALRDAHADAVRQLTESEELLQARMRARALVSSHGRAWESL